MFTAWIKAKRHAGEIEAGGRMIAIERKRPPRIGSRGSQLHMQRAASGGMSPRSRHKDRSWRLLRSDYHFEVI